MRALAIAVVVVAACRNAESFDDCMKVEQRKSECWEHTTPTAAGLDFIRESCESTDFRAARVDEAACLATTTCEQFTACDEPFERGNPFGVVH